MADAWDLKFGFYRFFPVASRHMPSPRNADGIKVSSDFPLFRKAGKWASSKAPKVEQK
jgi:hypothetical protein